MKQRFFAVAAVIWLAGLADAAAQGTTITYQGRLNEAGAPANGMYDLRFTIYDALTNGTVWGGPLTNSAAAVTNGLFTVLLDFGADAFVGGDRWLEVDVRPAGANSDFQALSPREPITAVPYAISAGGLPGLTIQPGPVVPSIIAGVSNSIGNFSGSIISGGTANSVNADFSTIAGGYSNSIVLSAVPALRGRRGDSTIPADGSSFIGGGGRNGVFIAQFSAILGGSNNVITGLSDFSAIGGGSGNHIASPSCVISGGSNNTVSSQAGAGLGYSVSSTVSGGAFNSVLGSAPFSTIAGGITNRAAADSCTISGGSNNLTLASFSTIGGGRDNFINNVAAACTIAGGVDNSIDSGSAGSTIAGGNTNRIYDSCIFSTISGGGNNTIYSDSIWCTIAGGYNNYIDANFATIGGGQSNILFTANSVIAGGFGNSIDSNSRYSAIAGGQLNAISSNAVYSAIGGGQYNSIGEDTPFGTISGGFSNVVNGEYTTVSGGARNVVNAYGGTIGGGNNNDVEKDTSVIAGGDYNQILNYASVIGGGEYNTNGGDRSFIGGGLQNLISSDNTFYCSILGGANNTIGAGSIDATVAGGQFNGILGNADATISGGTFNTNGSDRATIGGGYQNTIGSLSHAAFIGGGLQNTIFDNASSSTISGGSKNQIATGAAAASILGGNLNAIDSGGSYSTVVGGWGNSAGGNSAFAAGQYASALHDNTFVWSDGTSGPTPGFTSTGVRQFLILASHGVGINKNNPSTQYSLDIHGIVNSDSAVLAQNLGASNSITGATISATISVSAPQLYGQLNSGSDRNIKENFEAIEPLDILERVASLPITSWNFKTDPEVRHIGPMAQDFKAAFEVGIDDKHIGVVDAQGVALAAIQGLNHKLEAEVTERDAEIQRLKEKADKVDLLEKRLNELERALQLAHSQNQAPSRQEEPGPLR